MSTRGGNTIIRDGLAFHMDPADQNCWRGEPTINLVPNTDYASRIFGFVYPASSWGGSAGNVVYYSSGGYKNMPYKKLTRTTSGSGGSYLEDHNSFNIEDNKTYSVSCYLKGSRVQEVSGHALSLNRISDNAYRIPPSFTVTQEWQRFEWIYNSASGHSGVHKLRQINYENDDLPFEIYWCGMQIEERSTPTPFVAGTRGSTVETGGGVIDLSGYKNDSILTEGVGFKADNKGILVFNNIADYIGDSQFSVGSDPEVTISMWIRRTSTISNGGFWGLGGNGLNAGICGYTASQNKIGWDLWGRSTFHTGQDYPLNEWVYVCWVKDAPTFTTSTLKVYINGVLAPLTTIFRNNSSVVNLVDGYCFGNINMVNTQYGVKGEIGTSSIYNRALTHSEILQNFNATRVRYGI